MGGWGQGTLQRTAVALLRWLHAAANLRGPPRSAADRGDTFNGR